MKSVSFKHLPALKLEDYWRLLNLWPQDRPLLAWGGHGSQKCYFALSFQDMDDPSDCLRRPFQWQNSDEMMFPRYMGAIPYESFSPYKAMEKIRIFKVQEVLIFDAAEGKVYLAQDGEAQSTFQNVHEILKTEARTLEDRPLDWHASVSDDAYLRQVESCLEDIRNGRYYQINLLRFFKIKAEPYVNWYPYFLSHGGPFAAWIRVPGFEIISMSPERFVLVSPGKESLLIRTDPIKGTVAASSNPVDDAQQKARLLASAKDRAELSMIVDLMRNDLNRICKKHSVQVRDPGSLHSFSNVHHLIAQIEGELFMPSSLDRILNGLSPGGSITGAPKIEVMAAIREYEQRDRGYFMGHCFICSPEQGYLDSSILIRTVVREREDFVFAAGSGIVIHSKAELEKDEIWAKGRVVKLRP